jgi:hypothetical protein
MSDPLEKLEGKRHFISSIYKEDSGLPVSILPPLGIELKTLWGQGASLL